MSGIAGIVYPDTYQVNHLINPMLTTLAHRGKNPQQFTYKNIEVGVCGTTLAQNQNVTVGLDGRLQNRNELTQLLLEHGISAPSQSDAELILNAYETFGKFFLDKIYGDFALFIFDQQKAKIILARDRIGKKTLYWYHDQKTFIFASELKALLASGAVPQTPNTEAIATYLYFGYIPQDLSPIKGVNKLLPGYSLQINKDQSKTIQSYWSYSSFFDKKSETNEDNIVSNLNQLLKKNVQNCIPEDNSFGCMLSGGLGSTSVAYYAHQLSNKPINAYTVEFKDENEADMQAAETVAKTLHLNQKCDTITKESLMDEFVQIAWHLDEPLADPNVIASWRLAKLAKEGEVVLSGMGSDELFVGHARYTNEEHPISRWEHNKQALKSIINLAILPVLNFIYKPGVYKILQKSRTEPWQFSYLNQNALFQANELQDVAPKLAHLFDPHVFLHKFHNLSKIPSKISSLLYLDVKTRLPDFYILQLERLISAHGLDWRLPYLSKEVVEYVAGIQEIHQITDGGTHKLLKAILKKTIPDSVINRPKKTRKDFLNTWANDPEITDLFNLLPEGILAETGLISPKWIRDQLATPYHIKAAFKQLWSILALEVWFRIFINRPIEYEAPKISVKQLLTEK
jgi:asparagine synthase (glutamine-hydrolysing)